MSDDTEEFTTSDGSRDTVSGSADEPEKFGIAADEGVEASVDVSSSDGVYANPEKGEAEGKRVHSNRGDSSDEVDPRRLYRDPTLSELRWYYRREMGGILVNKPIDDAFKNGLEFDGDNADEVDRLVYGPEFDGDEHNGFVGAHKLCEKKARRDGFALLFIGTREAGSDGPHVSPISEDIDVDEITHFKVLTIDDLSSTAPHEQIQEGTGLDEEDYVVRDTGIVVNDDIESPDYRNPIGYVLSRKTEPQFIHADRMLHYTWNPEVDGDYKGNGVRRWNSRNGTLGQWEGDSVLVPSYNLLKGISKGNWSIMQALFRGASHVYSVKVPRNASDEEYDEADQAVRNVNAKSSFVWPDTEYEFEQHESGNQMEPRDHFDVVFDQLCANHEMTKSVLFGTQTGTVSGSETDIKNYFNKVQRYRTGRAETKFNEYLTRAKRIEDGRTNDDYTFEAEIEWGPLFKVDEDTKINMIQNASNAYTTLIGSYAMTPDEARSILSEHFTEIDLDSLSEDQMDVLDRINLTQSGQGPSALASEEEYADGPEGGASPSANAREGGQSGGMEQGQTTGAENPATDHSDNTPLSEQLTELAELYENDDLTEAEYETAKEMLLQDE